MLGKILITGVVILIAYLTIRSGTRRRAGSGTASLPSRQEPPLPTGALRTLAYGMATVLMAGSLLWMYLDYRSAREVVTVRVINASTGSVTTYRARRSDVQGRQFNTLDGRRVTLADVDRMELETGR
jgi:hypothetical protein